MANEDNATKVSDKEKAPAKPISTQIDRAPEVRHGNYANSTSIQRHAVYSFLA
jgi:hypothetical protein